jgi:hypothetical protein
MDGVNLMSKNQGFSSPGELIRSVEFLLNKAQDFSAQYGPNSAQ